MTNREPGHRPTGEANIQIGSRHRLGVELDALLDEVDSALIAGGVDPEGHFHVRSTGHVAVEGFEGKPQDNPMDPGGAV